ncbi:TetR/AcrR family transcriptional regulator [Maricurvus nonylphenolicus]|uniref:TetR/AcrR family transcriptional regulator n=1 Tax=Maricurvus nonylphenolicus TaxID=1008307 RepID=UPI0036F1AFCC
MAGVLKFDREEAVATAMMTFWSQGASNVSVKAFCDQVGITRSSFYNTFGSLDNLFEESLDLYLQDAPAKRLKRTDISALDGIHAMFKVLCKFRASDKAHKGCIVVNGLTELHSLEEGMQLSVLNRVNDTIDAFKQALKTAVENGDLDQDFNVDTTALALETLVIGINTISKVVHKEKELWAIAESTLLGLGIKPSAA